MAQLFLRIPLIRSPFDDSTEGKAPLSLDKGSSGEEIGVSNRATEIYSKGSTDDIAVRRCCSPTSGWLLELGGLYKG